MDQGEPIERQTTELRRLHPKIRSVWRFGATMSGLIMSAIFLVISVPFAIKGSWPVLPVAAGAMLIGFLLFGGISLFLIDKQFEHWRYQLREYDLMIQKGLIWRSERYIARDRIQHIDINTGPLDRRFGLAQVVVYVAGVTGSVGLIPGLTPQEAEWLKEQLLATRAMDV